MKEIANRIREVRLAKGLSQKELADRCGFRSRSSISKIEKDTYDISLESAKVIAKALGVDPDYLVFGDLSERDSSVNEVSDLFNQLDSDQQDAVLAFLRSMIARRPSAPASPDPSGQ